MTIFIIDTDPQKIAEQLDDLTLDKMIKEIAQVLCNVHHLINNENLSDAENNGGYASMGEEDWMALDKSSEIPLKETIHLNEWTLWASECRANYLWLIDLGLALAHEIHFRGIQLPKNKFVKYWNMFLWARDNVPDLPGVFITPFPLTTPKKYIVTKQIQTHCPDAKEDCLVMHYQHEPSTVESYRNYYNHKLKQAKIEPKWTRREKPEWVEL